MLPPFLMLWRSMRAFLLACTAFLLTFSWLVSWKRLKRRSKRWPDLFTSLLKRFTALSMLQTQQQHPPPEQQTRDHQRQEYAGTIGRVFR